MKLYLVRYGESESNAKKVHQDGTVSLSEKGMVQSEYLAKRLSALPIDCMLVSPFKRARQTADIINKKVLSFLQEKEILPL